MMPVDSRMRYVPDRCNDDAHIAPLHHIAQSYCQVFKYQYWHFSGGDGGGGGGGGGGGCGRGMMWAAGRGRGRGRGRRHQERLPAAVGQQCRESPSGDGARCAGGPGDPAELQYTAHRLAPGVCRCPGQSAAGSKRYTPAVTSHTVTRTPRCAGHGHCLLVASPIAARGRST